MSADHSQNPQVLPAPAKCKEKLGPAFPRGLKVVESFHSFVPISGCRGKHRHKPLIIGVDLAQ